MNGHLISLVATETQHLLEDLQPNVMYRLASENSMHILQLIIWGPRIYDLFYLLT